MRTALERRLSVEAARRIERDVDVDVDFDVAAVSHLYPVWADPANETDRWQLREKKSDLPETVIHSFCLVLRNLYKSRNC